LTGTIHQKIRPVPADITNTSKSPLHLCTSRRPLFKGNGSSSTLPISYQCAGDAYEQFGQELQTLLASNNSTKGGRRAFPFPHNATVLFTGNSHMAQVAHELICQYAGVVDRFTVLDTGIYGWYSATVFENGAHLYHASNTPVVYSRDWVTHLEELFDGVSLRKLTAVVYGNFHRYKPSILKTGFGKGMLEADGIDGIDFAHIEPPGLSELLDVYPGPVIAVSMFASYAANQAVQYQAIIDKQFNRTNVRAIDSRKYVDVLGECGSAGGRLQTGPSACWNNKTAGNMHRCTGIHGGHPDLIAWDVIEAVYELVSED
jgi:hypothetical protein